MEHLQELAAVNRDSSESQGVDDISQNLMSFSNKESKKEDSDSTEILFLAPDQNQRERE